MKGKDYIAFISNGKQMSVSSVKEIVELEPHDQVIQADECICTHKEHIAKCEIENVVVSVENPRQEVFHYVVEMAFCTECAAYYIPQESYEYLAKKGVILHAIKGGTRLFEYMKFGAAFEEEKVQLQKIQQTLTKEYNNLPKPYYGRYVGSDKRDGIYDVQSRKYSDKKIYEMQDTLNEMISEPYIGRIDISNNGNERITYYIGRTEDKTIGGIMVYSRWSPQGRLFGRIAETTGIIGGISRQVDLRRRIDIISGKLRGIEDVFSSNSEFAEKKIYDEFLIKVLISRKKSHKLTDIIATIQDNQNRIIEKAYVANIIVQGCAGSGKTMVMLHRLSFWLYNNKSLKPEKIKVLTPNANEKVHIEELHEQLNLGRIEIMSVEQYYIMLLERYNMEIASYTKIDEEENVEERFLNYVYSKSFVKKFKAQYKNEKLKYALSSEIDFIKNCAVKCGIPVEKLNQNNAGNTIIEMTRLLQKIINKNSTSVFNRERIQEKIAKHKDIFTKSENKKLKAEQILMKYEQNYKQELIVIIEKFIKENDVVAHKLEEQHIKKEKNLEVLKKNLLHIVNASNFKNEEEILKKLKRQLEETKKKQGVLSLLKLRVTETEDIKEATEKVNGRKLTKEEIDIAIEKRIEENIIVVHKLEKQCIEKEKDLELLKKNLSRIVNAFRLKEEVVVLEKLKKQLEENKKRQNDLLLLKAVVIDSKDIEDAIEKVNSSKKIIKKYTFIEEYLTEYHKEKQVVLEQRTNMELAMKARIEEEKNLSLMEMLLSVDETEKIKKLALKYPHNVALVIFNNIFENVIKEKLIELELKKPEKTYRYELYARVIFSELFWEKTVGEDELICIDEGQDISYCEYECIIAQNEKNHAYYNVYGDLNQRIKYGRGLRTWEQLKRRMLAHEFLLNENYRNTNQITQYCNDILNFDMALTGVEGTPIRNITFDEMLTELVDLVDIKERTAIILPRTISKQRVTRAKKIENVREKISIKFDVSKISIMYVDEVKGIEFDCAYVLAQDMEKNEKYIAFTRALDNLTIVH